MLHKTSEIRMHYKLINAINRGDGSTWQEVGEDMVKDCMTLRRLANKHHKLAEMECNGEGWIRGIHYSFGFVSDGQDWQKSAYDHKKNAGFNNPEASDDTSIFDVESGKVQDKIEAICKRIGLRAEFQGDPRGYTVKFFKGDRFMDIQG